MAPEQVDMNGVSRALAKVERSQQTIGHRIHALGAKLLKISPCFKSFNFILFHYIYMILMTLIGSIIIYPGGPMSYTDALFHMAGATTQSGLNTINLNDMHTFQQAFLLIWACLCNPITINTFVVYLRLYWFEKKFQHIVGQARRWQKSRIETRTKSLEIPHVDLERGITRDNIRVMHADDETNTAAEPAPRKNSAPRPLNADNEISTAPGAPTRSKIVFADEVDSNAEKNQGKDTLHPRPRRRSTANVERETSVKTREQHREFFENQRNPKDKSILRIPGPREIEQGHIAERIDPQQDPEEAVEEDDSDLEEDEQKEEEAARSAYTRISRHLNPPAMPDIRHRKPRQFSRQVSTARSITSYLSRSISQARHDLDPQPYLSYNATIGRNSMFFDLNEEQREELGGIEYRALKTLFRILLIYNIGWSLFGIIVWLPWILRNIHHRQIVEGDAVNPVWWAFYTPISHFTDLGFTLTPDSMISFNQNVLPMLFGSWLIVIGNTGFPILLRFVIWLTSVIVPWGNGLWEELRFLLDHPRRCFTLLFPHKATWWLFFVLVVLNVIDLVFFVLLDLKDPTVTDLPGGYQFLDGFYQAFSTRTAGFACVNLADLHPGIQVSYFLMMYISVLPIALSIRQTNVYEENSLGVYSAKLHESEEDADENAGNTRSYLGSHLRRQLSFDLWYVFLGLFLICIVEGAQIQDPNKPAFNIWSVMFEVVSAYGTVGLSLGYPNTDASFSSQFHTLSKLIIIAMMLRGRHRGLPYSLDRAILLPGKGVHNDAIPKRDEHGEVLSNIAEGKENEAVNGSQAGELNDSGTKKTGKGWNVGGWVAYIMLNGPKNKTKKRM